MEIELHDLIMEYKMHTEQHFLDEMIANPDDDLPRLAMADWLEEQGDPRAELMRIQEQLRRIEVPNRDELEARMRELLYEENVQPVVPTITNSIGMKFALIPTGSLKLHRRHQRPMGSDVVYLDTLKIN